MKQIVLSISFLFIALAAFSQVSSDRHDYESSSLTNFARQTKISVYPNPATNFISVDNADNVKQINVFNLVGRKLKSFDSIVKDEHYDVTDLQNGMYLVQILDFSNKIITTQRISKR
ncbi:MAG: T9SS type A sorting domain-containing protein [Bacteroidota bacterium]